jgi:hypothetical protein
MYQVCNVYGKPLEEFNSLEEAQNCGIVGEIYHQYRVGYYRSLGPTLATSGKA